MIQTEFLARVHPHNRPHSALGGALQRALRCIGQTAKKRWSDSAVQLIGESTSGSRAGNKRFSEVRSDIPIFVQLFAKNTNCMQFSANPSNVPLTQTHTCEHTLALPFSTSQEYCPSCSFQSAAEGCALARQDEPLSACGLLQKCSNL